MHHVDLNAITLGSGSHFGATDGPLCVMEWVSVFADERKIGDQTDSPKCTSRVLTNFAIAFNDSLDNETRQRLIPFIPRLVGTAGNTKLDNLRAWMATDWLVRTYAPAFLRLTPSLVEHADTLAALPPITNAASATKAQAKISAAYSAARSAARSAADSAARSAAYSAAHSAADSAAHSAAHSAARSALAPTVAELQESAFALFDRMIDAGGARKAA